MVNSKGVELLSSIGWWVLLVFFILVTLPITLLYCLYQGCYSQYDRAVGIIQIGIDYERKKGVGEEGEYHKKLKRLHRYFGFFDMLAK